jgi:hypothetical protein
LADGQHRFARHLTCRHRTDQPIDVLPTDRKIDDGLEPPRRDEVGQRAEVGADGCAVTSVGEEGQDAGAFMSDEV